MQMRAWSRRIIIAIVFLIAVIGFSFYFNQGTTDLTVEMQDASLPIAYIDVDGNLVNEMHGYTERMNNATLRDSVTPIDEKREINLCVRKYGQSVSSLSYELRSTDGERLIEDTDIVSYRDLASELTTTIALKDLIEEGVEYSLTVVLNLSDGREIYYYTRVIQNSECNPAEDIEFVLDFNAKTFSEDTIKELSTYLEPSQAGDNSDFGHADIHSSLKHISWGNMEPRRVTDKQVTISEISDSMASIELRYQISVADEGRIKRYNVTEFYRIRRSSERFHLLTFDRDVSEIYEMSKDSIDGDSIDLGIQSEELIMTESEGEEVIAFVNGGRLYSFNLSENKLTRLFAFYDDGNEDYRHQFIGNKIKVLNVEENGNVSFLVYGYMNRGIYEGRVGVELYYYDSVVNTIEEQVFIPYYKSPEILMNDVEKLSYINSDGNLYLFLDGAVYKVSTADMTCETIAEDLSDNSFCVSKSGGIICWQDVDAENKVSSGLNILNLVSENLTTIVKSTSEYVRPIGFMNEDLIYGICNKNDISWNTFGDIVFPMNEIVIQSSTGAVLKNYKREGVYILSGEIEENQISLHRAMRDGETSELVNIEDDHITSNDAVVTGKNRVIRSNSEKFKYIDIIKLKNEIDNKLVKLLTPKEVLYEGGRTMEFDEPVDDRFIMYGNGHIDEIVDDVSIAVSDAYDVRGSVYDMRGNEIYKRGETHERNQIMAIEEESITDAKDSMAVCLDTMLKLEGISRNTEKSLENGDSAYDILKNNLYNAYTLNLSGCPADSALYYVNQDIPVLAMSDKDSAVLIIGFNAQNMVLMDPESGTIYKKGINDSREMFELAGNKFLTYKTMEE